MQIIITANAFSMPNRLSTILLDNAIKTFIIVCMDKSNAFSPLDEVAAAYLAPEIAAAQTDIQLVDKQIADLQAKRRALVFKVERLGGDILSVTAKLEVLPKDERAEQPEVSGFRAMILGVLRETAGGIASPNVADQLIAKGVKYEGKTPLKVRVANDLYALTQSEKVKRKGKLYYLVREPRQAETLN